MKRMKSLLALLLTAAILLTAGVTALAAGSGTQADPYVGSHDYGHADKMRLVLHKLDIGNFERKKAAELIAAGTLPAGGTVTFKGNIPTGASLAAGAVVGTYTTSASATEVNVTLNDLTALNNIVFRIEQVALSSGKTPGSNNPADYSPVASGIDGYAKTDGSGEIDWTGLPTGYYRITEVANKTGTPVGADSFVLSLPMVDPADESKTIDTVHVYPKNRASAEPEIEKEKPDLNDYNGNILSWTIKAEIPATLEATKGSQKFVIKDTMSAGIKYSGNMKVFYKSGGADVPLTSGTDYSTSVAAGDTSFTITLEAPGFSKLGGALPNGIDKDSAGRYILYVTYDTVVDISKADLEAGTNPKNEVTLEFTNNDGTDYTKTPDPVEVEDYAALQVIKKDGANDAVLLKDAEFKIYTKLNGAGTDVDPASVLKDATGAEIVFKTDANGTFFYGGLGEGDYYIVETLAPGGYKLLTSYTTIQISAADVSGNAVKEATVFNYLDNGLTLPSTGGVGTMFFMIGGGALILGAIIFFLVGRKKEAGHAGRRGRSAGRDNRFD